MPRVDLESAQARRYDICVVGSGAAGLAVATAASARGQTVLIVERGGLEATVDPEEPDIAAGAPHDAAQMTIRQGFGGTLALWGGRCVPFDREDFDHFRGNAAAWPICYEDYAAWVPPACEFLGVSANPARRSPSDWPQELTSGGPVRADSVEQLSPGRLLRDLRQKILRNTLGPDLLLDCPVVALDWCGTRVGGVIVAPRSGRATLTSDRTVLAGGGLQTVRLLLAEARANPGRIHGEVVLGCSYMGHLTGSISEIAFNDPKAAAAFAYRHTAGKAPARRRFVVLDRDLPHVAFWPENLPRHDFRQSSGERSIKALASGGGEHWRKHLQTVFADPIGAGHGIASAIRTRLNREVHHPDRLILCGRGPYRLAYHAEHLPDVSGRVLLTDRLDKFGAPTLRIDFDYGETTLHGTLRAHRTLADTLLRGGFAALKFDGEEETLKNRISTLARDGYHQIGVTRMSDHPDRGVVDRDCRVFGVNNLFVASAGVFPVSSQANPTLSIVALALRLAGHLSEHRQMTAEAKEIAP